ncbi:hypothetical protein Slala04_54560 [Streptomyces lavendulae subsp. lavendulae]|nr:hypothetical protein Slala04_54560 [Streptomyces lavendulae subsp. lavendulae]
MAAYVQPQGLADAVSQERVAIGRAPGFARAGQSPVPGIWFRPVPLGVSRLSSYFRGGTGGQGWPEAIA